MRGEDRRPRHDLSATNESPGGSLLRLWGRLARFPGGKLLFAELLGKRVPYTGTIRPRIEELRPGFARVSIGERRRIRNHLRSIHAIALTNLGEVTTGLAVLTALPPEARAIVVRLETDYVKKARGRITALCTCEEALVAGAADRRVSAELRDGGGDLVATFTATWRVDRKP